MCRRVFVNYSGLLIRSVPMNAQNFYDRIGFSTTHIFCSFNFRSHKWSADPQREREHTQSTLRPVRPHCVYNSRHKIRIYLFPCLILWLRVTVLFFSFFLFSFPFASFFVFLRFSINRTWLVCDVKAVTKFVFFYLSLVFLLLFFNQTINGDFLRGSWSPHTAVATTTTTNSVSV